MCAVRDGHHNVFEIEIEMFKRGGNVRGEGEREREGEGVGAWGECER